MKKGDIKNKSVAGEIIPCSFLGKGMFCQAFRRLDTGRVLCFCKEDFTKEILTWDQCKLPHIPDVTRVDRMDDADYIYEMPYYEKLTASNKAAWSAYKALDAAWEQGRRKAIGKGAKTNQSFHALGADINRYTIEAAKTAGNVPEAIIEALEAIADSASNYGQHYTFEFAPRNLKVDADGNLILLDVIFDAKALFEIRQGKRGIK